MLLNEVWQQIGFGIAGGLAAEILHWYRLSRRPARAKPYRTHPGYWLWTIGMIALSGLMPILYVVGTATALLCFHLGATTPLLLQKVIASVPAVANRQGAADSGSASFREFVDW